MENLITINAEARKETGKKICKNLRKTGKIPAIIYGGTDESMAVTVAMSEIKAVLKTERGENAIFRIVREGDKKHTDAMFKDIQYDYLSNHIVHIDMMRIDLNKPVDVEIPIVLHGEPIGVKLEDGLLEFVSREVSVRCLPIKIPKEIRVDISGLHSNHSIKVENLPEIDGLLYLSSGHTVICAVAAKGKEEVTAETAATEVASAAAQPAAEPAKDAKKEG
jgi:large subunit ribosomal protein L25